MAGKMKGPIKGPTPKQLDILQAIGKDLERLKKLADKLAPELAKAYEHRL